MTDQPVWNRFVKTVLESNKRITHGQIGGSHIRHVHGDRWSKDDFSWYRNLIGTNESLACIMLQIAVSWRYSGYTFLSHSTCVWWPSTINTPQSPLTCNLHSIIRFVWHELCLVKMSMRFGIGEWHWFRFTLARWRKFNKRLTVETRI